MLFVWLWMVVDFENATSEEQRDKQTENWSKLSIALHILLPVAGLAIFLKQKHILSRLLLQLDRNCVSVFCPSFSKREKLLKWAGSRLPGTWSSHSRTLCGGISELWKDGSLLCTLINSAIPGACLNPHRHWKKPPLHAQAIAYKYLGVVPIFTDKDLSGELTIMLERSFLRYLDELHQAIMKLTERNELNRSVSNLYAARGMGLFIGEQHRKTIFYVYPNTQPTICNNSNILIHIRGPYGTYGKAVIPKFHNDLFTSNEVKMTPDLVLTKNLLKKDFPKQKNPFMNNFSLPFMHYHKKHMGDNIIIHVSMEDERAKVIYIPKNYGMYEIIMVANGELVKGCPFNVHILNNTSGIEETLESEEKEEEIPHARKRKVISKTIDFIDEQVTIDDLQKRYNNMENKIHTDTNFKQIINKITLNDVMDGIKDKSSTQNNPEQEEEKKRVNGILNSQATCNEESFKTKQEQRKIEEEEEDEVFSQEQSISNTDIDELKTSDDNLTDGPSSILEKQNLESVNENQKAKSLPRTDKELEHVSNENKLEDISCKLNNHSNKEVIPDIVNNDINLDPNKIPMIIKDSRELVDNQSQENYNGGDIITNNNESILSFNEYPKPIVVKKIHIPEKFSAYENISPKDFVDGLDAKYFKNVINNSNKREIPRHLLRSSVLKEGSIKQMKMDKNQFTSEKSDNEVGDKTSVSDSSLENNKVKQNLIKALSRQSPTLDIEKINAIPKRFFQTQEPSNPLEHQSPTSPICSDHIVPEVNSEFRRLSVAERRKIFAKQSATNFSFSTNSSFSENESAETLKDGKQFRQIEGLSVLNVLGSLKRVETARKHKNYTLHTTKSLPNIPSVEAEYIFQNSVKERKNFWEKLSSSSSSLSVSTEPSPRRIPRKLTEEERCRLIWKKPNEAEALENKTMLEERLNLEKSTEVHKSADDILSITDCTPYQSPKKYKSLDNSLDTCTVLSIEERKKMLLKQNYAKEKIERGKFGTLKQSNNVKTSRHNIQKITEEKIEDSNNKDEEAVVFSPIVEKIKKYDSAWNLPNNNNEEENKPCRLNNDTNKSISENYIHNDLQELPKPQKTRLKSHFKKAIRYFKNLEEKSLGKTKPTSEKKDLRRYSLNLEPSNNKNKINRKGGSLNLPNVSERFSINNLYQDVFGNRKGSFKGAANRSAVVEALATFSRKEDPSFNGDNEDEIKYDIFKKRAKNRKRKSIRSIFDVYY